MDLGELILDLERLRNALGDTEVSIMVNGMEQDVEVAVIGNRVILVSESEARIFPDEDIY